MKMRLGIDTKHSAVQNFTLRFKTCSHNPTFSVVLINLRCYVLFFCWQTSKVCDKKTHHQANTQTTTQTMHARAGSGVSIILLGWWHQTGASRSIPTVHPCPLRWGGLGELKTTPAQFSQLRPHGSGASDTSSKESQILPPAEWWTVQSCNVLSFPFPQCKRSRRSWRSRKSSFSWKGPSTCSSKYSDRCRRLPEHPGETHRQDATIRKRQKTDVNPQTQSNDELVDAPVVTQRQPQWMVIHKSSSLTESMTFQLCCRCMLSEKRARTSPKVADWRQQKEASWVTVYEDDHEKEPCSLTVGP